MNQRGSVILWGLMLCTVIGIATVTAAKYTENFTVRARSASVRSRLTALEGEVRNMAFQPYAYKCGSDNGNDAISSINKCVVFSDYFQNLKDIPVPGADCSATTPNCGFHMDTPTITPDPANPAVGIFHALITYNGKEGTPIRPSDITLTIPTEVLQSSSFDCALKDATRPVMVGFTGDGTPDCRGFTPVDYNNVKMGGEAQPCPKGYYATMINFDKLTIQCDPVATNDKKVTCPYGTAISSVTWGLNGQVVQPAGCTGLPSPPYGGPNGGGWTSTPAPAGACGPANGSTVTAAPTTGLCAQGNPSAVTGSGPFTWTCDSPGGVASCSAGVKNDLHWEVTWPPFYIPVTYLPNGCPTMLPGGSKNNPCTVEAQVCTYGGLPNMAGPTNSSYMICRPKSPCDPP